MPTVSDRHARLDMRSRALMSIRRFFTERDYVEVETPVRIETPALELHIDAEPSGDRYLRTSPELHMKRLLAAGYERIFQMGPCFRAGEQGALHHPEYTMLEWYRAEADYETILADLQALLRHVVHAVTGGSRIHWHGYTVDVDGDWAIESVQAVFQQWAGWDPVVAFDADRFDIDLVERIEPRLKECTVPCILKDYPAPAAALARCRSDNPVVAERWECYMAGIELANAYSELNDPAEQQARFAACAEARRQAGLTVYPLDTAFLESLAAMPSSGGIALGFDRLAMLCAGVPTIADVTAFQEC